ncbi:MAG: metallophosphoesterase [Planctomycetes bacterium]|nr:metallophosphoesterase [Planctomycetota bacterium]
MRGVAGIVLLAAVAPAAAQDSLVSIGDQAYLTETFAGGHVSVIRYPTLGLPEIVRTGNTARAILKLPSAQGAQVTITATDDPIPIIRTLPVIGTASDPLTDTTTITFSVPADVPEDTYDLAVLVPGQGIADQQPNCFKVVAQETSTFNFVVIADPQFNDPRGIFSPSNHNPNNYNAWSIARQIKKEIRALNPTFAVLCGDLLFGLDYTYEYEGAWNLWKDTGVPIFMVPGNHDGYASTTSREIFGIPFPARDGLNDWRRMMGPTYFSFDFGGLHFQGVNSYDGPASRRDSFLIVVENYGGDLSQTQMNWIAADVAARPIVIPFLHHSPLGPYSENRSFGLTWWIINAIVRFVTSGEFWDNSQVWNTEATAAFLKALYSINAPFVFVGHEHHDDIRSYGGTVYKLVTAAATRSADYWGYGYVKVQDGAIADYLYGGTEEQSIPAGNLHVINRGTEATIRSGLSRSYDLTLEFLVQQMPSYAAAGGEVLRWAPAGDGLSRVWVRAATPVATAITAPVESMVVLNVPAPGPSSNPMSAVPTPVGGCAATEAPANAMAILTTLSLLALGWWRSHRGR